MSFHGRKVRKKKSKEKGREGIARKIRGREGKGREEEGNRGEGRGERREYN